MSKFGPKPKGRIDLGLAICAATRRGPLSTYEIAPYCGCSRSLIFQIEQRALRRARRACREIGLEQFFEETR